MDRIAKWIGPRSLVTNSITILITIRIAISITNLITIQIVNLITCGPDRRLDLDLIQKNYGLYGVKVDLGPKVGSDQEKSWFFMESKLLI